MVGVAQLVRVSDCGPEGRGFDPHFPPKERRKPHSIECGFLFFLQNRIKGQNIFPVTHQKHRDIRDLGQKIITFGIRKAIA